MLTVENLKTYFHTRNGVIRAVDGVSLEVGKGETIGIVGESGSGKSVTCLSLAGLVQTPPGIIESGRALFDGKDLLKLSAGKLQKIRGNGISMIFQDPMTSLNPYLTIGVQLTEHLRAHQGIRRKEACDRAVQSLTEVGITDPRKRLDQYVHELSGGMRQRVMIAMALITGPDLLIADEPTTALDVTIQAQILDLMEHIQNMRRMGIIFITHDLGVIARIADRILVMYAGKIVESGKTRDIFYRPSHPYTRALLNSIPSLNRPGQKLRSVPGMPPDLSMTSDGCSFAPRCDEVFSDCYHTVPHLKEISDGHLSGCIKEMYGKDNP